MTASTLLPADPAIPFLLEKPVCPAAGSPRRLILVTVLALALTEAAFPELRAADEISSILDQIKTEKISAKPAEGPATSATVHAEKPSSPPSKISTGKSASTKHSAPTIKIWAPGDKLPKDIAGQGVAGVFVVKSEHINGGATIVAAEESINPFAREFTIVNITTGLPRGTYIPIGRRETITISKAAPLIFIGRGIVPGSYMVKVQK